MAPKATDKKVLSEAEILAAEEARESAEVETPTTSTEPAGAKALDEYSVSELQAMATGEGVFQAEVFTDKKQLIALIANMRAMKAANHNVATVSTGGPNPAELKVDPIKDAEAKRSWQTKLDRTKARLDAEDKVRIMIPLDIGEKKGAYEVVVVNGYRLNIMKGVMVNVPETIANIITESYQLTAEVGKDLLLDRIDPKTGSPVADRLE